MNLIQNDEETKLLTEEQCRRILDALLGIESEFITLLPNGCQTGNNGQFPIINIGPLLNILRALPAVTETEDNT